LIIALFVSNAFADIALPATRIVQKGRSCWAASATVVAGLYNKMPDDRANQSDDSNHLGLCEAINVHNMQDDCGRYGGPWCKDQAPHYVNCCDYWYGEDPVSEPDAVCTHGGGPTLILDALGINYTYVNGALTASQIETEIVTNRRPILINHSYPNDSHYITIVGYHSSTTDVCTMNSWDDNAPEGGFWCTTYNDVVGTGQTWNWDFSYKITNNRHNATSLIVKNAPELPAGATSATTPQIHRDAWAYFLAANSGTALIGPYIFDNPDLTWVAGTSSFPLSARLLPGFVAEQGSRLIIQPE
jgi:hypothetical protein